MSVEEFALHQAYWRHEPSGPEGEMLRWSALMAAVVNGPLVKRDKTRFKGADFWSAEEAWPVPQEAVITKGGKKQRMAPDLSHMRGMKVANRKR